MLLSNMLRWLAGWPSSQEVSPESSALHYSRATSTHDSDDSSGLLDCELEYRLHEHIRQLPSSNRRKSPLDLDVPWRLMASCLDALMKDASALSDGTRAELSLLIQYTCTAADRTTSGLPPAKDLYRRLEGYMRLHIRRTWFHVTDRWHCAKALVKFYLKKRKQFLASARKVALLFTCVHEDYVSLEGERGGDLIGVYPYLVGLWDQGMFGPDALDVVRNAVYKVRRQELGLGYARCADAVESSDTELEYATEALAAPWVSPLPPYQTEF